MPAGRPWGARGRQAAGFATGWVASVHDCAYTQRMGIEWDPVKARSNLRKHGIDFADAVSALEDENALTMEDPLL